MSNVGHLVSVARRHHADRREARAIQRLIHRVVRADMVVTGDADFKGCDVNPSNGHRDFVSWLGEGEGERYQQVSGQVDRLWILDVRGSRVLVDATYSPDASEADRDVLDQIATSIRFPRRLT